MCSLSRRDGLPAGAPGQSRVIKRKSCESSKKVCDGGCARVTQECFTRHTRPLQLRVWSPPKKTDCGFSSSLCLFFCFVFFPFIIYSLKLYVTRAACARYNPNHCRVHLLSPINSGGGGVKRRAKHTNQPGRGAASLH